MDLNQFKILRAFKSKKEISVSIIIYFFIALIASAFALAGNEREAVKCDLFLTKRDASFQTFQVMKYKTTWICEDEQMYFFDDKDVYDQATEEALITTEDVGGKKVIKAIEFIKPKE